MENKPATTPSAPKKWLPACFALLLAGAFAGWHLASWPIRLQFPGDGDLGGDSMPLVETVHLRRAVPIYALASPEGYNGANWGPLFYLLGARIVDPQEPAYRPLRVLSMVGTLGCAAGCALLAFWFSRRYLAAVLAPLIFLSYGVVTRHGVSSRSDAIALLLSLAGFLLAYRFQDSRRLLLAVPLLLLGFFYKQQFVAGSVAVLLFLYLERRYRLALEFAGLLALGGVGLLLYFQFMVFSGQAFLHHFVFYNVLPFRGGALALGVLYFVAVLLVPSVVGLQSLRVRPDKLLRCYLGSSVCLSLVTFPRVGSDFYYFYECMLILSVLFAALIAQTLAESSRVSELLLLLAVSLFAGHLSPPPPRREDFRQDRAVQDYLKQHFSPQTPALGYYSGDLIRAGLEAPISNLFHYTWLVRKGTIPDRELLTQIQSHRFGVVVLHFDLQATKEDYTADFYLTPPMRQALRENYRLATVLDTPGPQKYHAETRFYAWVPRPRSNATPPNGPPASD